MSARDAILNKLRAARGDAPATHVASISAWYGPAEAVPVGERISQMRSMLEAVRGEVLVAGPDQWAGVLAARIARGGVKRLLMTRDTAEARALEAALVDIQVLSYDRPIEAWKDELFNTIDAGFTVADCAIAATGTLVLKSSPVKPRTLSLVPSLHFALVHAKDIHPRMIDAMTAENWAGGLPTNLVMISGPSKTSDIQQTVAYGAHGPKEFIVMVVSEEAAS